MATLQPMKLNEFLLSAVFRPKSPQTEMHQLKSPIERSEEPTPRANYLKYLLRHALFLDIQSLLVLRAADSYHASWLCSKKRIWTFGSRQFGHTSSLLVQGRILPQFCSTAMADRNFFMDKDSDLYKAALDTGAESSAEGLILAQEEM